MKVGHFLNTKGEIAETVSNEPDLTDFTQSHPKIDPLERPRIGAWRAGDTPGSLEFATPPTQSTEVVQLPGSLGKYMRFMPIAEAFALMSKMPNTKVGALILGNAFQVLSTGWNGAPRRSNADVDGRLANRATRLTWVCHAEINAITNAARSGTAINGGTLVVTLQPCMNCAKAIVQSGILRVICPTPTDPRWADDFANARSLFEECGVDLVYCDTLENEE